MTRSRHAPDTTTGTHTDWRDHAACQGAPVELFFPTSGQTTETRTAKAYCETCPVRSECLAEAHRFGAETFGIWGGTSETDRSRSRQARPASSGGQRGGARRCTPPETVARVVAAFRDSRHLHASDNAAAVAVAALTGVSYTSVLTWARRAETTSDHTEPAAG